MKYELPSTELIVIEENNYLKFGEYLNDMQCDDVTNKLCLDDLEYVNKLQQENKQLKDNWNKLKEYMINNINNRNGYKVAEYEDGGKVSETISPIYTLMEDKSKTMKEVLDKMQEIEQGSDSNE